MRPQKCPAETPLLSREEEEKKHDDSWVPPSYLETRQQKMYQPQLWATNYMEMLHGCIVVRILWVGKRENSNDDEEETDRENRKTTKKNRFHREEEKLLLFPLAKPPMLIPLTASPKCFIVFCRQKVNELRLGAVFGGLPYWDFIRRNICVNWIGNDWIGSLKKRQITWKGGSLIFGI